jgi:NhaC family Na+:H+ antiporter
VVIVVGTVIVGLPLQTGLQAVFLPLTLGVGAVGVLNLLLHRPWATFQAGVIDGVSKVGVALLILLLIGALVGVWIQGGVVPTLVYYGLRILSPTFFLPSAFLVCLLMSLAMGTSYGTIGTVGIALVGVSVALRVDVPVTAGAVLCGAYFGDKMSPLSDTTNIAAAVGEADVFRHIRSMMYTTIPAAIITLGLFFLVGRGEGSVELDQIQPMLAAIGDHWHVSPLHLVPILLMLGMALRRVGTLLLLFVSVVVGMAWAGVFQGGSLASVFSAATVGFVSNTGVGSVDQVLTRGGMTSMQAVIVLVLLAGALGGALQATGVLTALVEGMARWIRSTGGLIAAVLVSCYLVILFTGNQALALILVGQVFLPVFKDRRIDSVVLTRSLEDSGTLAAPLVPWGAAGGVCSQLLGVPTLQYLPYMWLAFLVPVFSLLYGFTGFAVWSVVGDPGDPPPEPTRLDRS